MRQARRHQGRIQLLRRHAEGIDAHTDLFLETAAHLHCGHTGQRLELALDAFFGQPAQLHQLALATARALRAHQGQAQHRIQVRVVAQDQRLLDTLRQEHAIELVAHILHGEAHLRAPLEVEHHIARLRA